MADIKTASKKELRQELRERNRTAWSGRRQTTATRIKSHAPSGKSVLGVVVALAVVFALFLFTPLQWGNNASDRDNVQRTGTQQTQEQRQEVNQLKQQVKQLQKQSKAQDEKIAQAEHKQKQLKQQLKQQRHTTQTVTTAATRRGPPSDVKAQLRQAGLHPGNFTTKVNWARADQVAQGTDAFSNANPHTQAKLVQTLRSNPKALHTYMQASGLSRAQALDASAWMPVQATSNVKYASGMSYNANGTVVWGHSFVDPAGAVLWINLHGTQGVVVRALCLNVAHAPIRTHEQPTHPQPPAVVHHPHAPPAHHHQPPKHHTPPAHHHQPPTCQNHPHMPKCHHTPPPTCQNHPHMPKCHHTPPPSHHGNKCKDKETRADGLCGTPDSGAEQQPVQDNNPGQTASAPGYHSGDAEQNAQEQGPPCSGSSCGLDQTQSGTEVSDSGDGGKAPGGGTTTPDQQPNQSSQPADSGQDNPAYDGSSQSTNPDQGTSDPVDSGATQHDSGNTDGPGGTDNSTHDSGASSGDPLGGVSLPNTTG